MRDALSLLDQCIAFYLGETLTYDNVLEVLGAVDTEVFSRLLRQLLAMDVHQVLSETVDELVDAGKRTVSAGGRFYMVSEKSASGEESDDMEDVLDMSENLAL